MIMPLTLMRPVVAMCRIHVRVVRCLAIFQLTMTNPTIAIPGVGVILLQCGDTCDTKGIRRTCTYGEPGSKCCTRKPGRAARADKLDSATCKGPHLGSHTHARINTHKHQSKCCNALSPEMTIQIQFLHVVGQHAERCSIAIDSRKHNNFHLWRIHGTQKRGPVPPPPAKNTQHYIL